MDAAIIYNTRKALRVTPFCHLFLPAAILCLAASLLFAPPAPAATDDTAPPTAGLQEEKQRSFSTGSAFLDDANISGGLYYFQRKRTRYDMERQTFEDNLDHATLQAGAEFSSGFLGNFVGLDVGVYASLDLYSNGAPDHEMDFMPWANPWRPDWSARHTDNGASIYKAHLKAKYKDAWLKAGYFQPTGPGVLGVNWSIFPGTYLGAEAGFENNGFSATAAYVTQYKAPWYQEFYHFRRTDAQTNVDYLWSLGGKYAFQSGLSLELAYGESQDFLRNAHLKAAYSSKLRAGELKTGYHLYLMADSDDSGSINDNFAGTASQHYLFAAYTLKNWTAKAELTYTLAPQDDAVQLGYFAYRLVNPNGGAKGAYEAWWDNRSDWNHDREKAVFAGIWYSFADFGLPGLTAGLSGAYGWGGKAYGIEDDLQESAWSLDLGYTMQEGFFKGASLKAHYTKYYNHSEQPSWTGFKNAFQNENDFKLLLSFPFSL